MFLTPIRIGSLGSFGDLGSGAAEYKSYVKIRVLLLDQDMLLSILCEEATFALYDDAVL